MSSTEADSSSIDNQHEFKNISPSPHELSEDGKNVESSTDSSVESELTASLENEISQAKALKDRTEAIIDSLLAVIKEKYDRHFPELSEIIEDRRDYVRAVQDIGDRSNATEVDLSSYVSEDHLHQITEAAQLSTGETISREDLNTTIALCSAFARLSSHTRRLKKFLKDPEQRRPIDFDEISTIIQEAEAIQDSLATAGGETTPVKPKSKKHRRRSAKRSDTSSAPSEETELDEIVATQHRKKKRRKSRSEDRTSETTIPVVDDDQSSDNAIATTIRWSDEVGADLKQVHILDYKYNRRGHPIRKRPGKIEMCTKTQKIVLGISGAVISLIIVIMVIILLTSPSGSPPSSQSLTPTTNN